MTWVFLGAMLGWPPRAWGAGEFLANMHKAETRSKTAEKIEYYSRAILAWMPEDGATLLAHCHFRRGEARFTRYEFKSAEPDLSKALEADPRNAKAYFLRGRIHLRAGRARQAVRDFAEYVGLSSDDMDGLLALGEAQRKAGQFEAAQKTYERAALLEPADFRPPLGVGEVRMARKDWRGGIEAFNSADQLAKGRSPEAIVARAVCRVGLGDAAGALKDFGAGLPLHESRLADLERARAHPVELADQQALTGRAYYGRGRVHEAQGLGKEAMKDYREGCRLGEKRCCARAGPEVAPKAAPAARAPAPLPKRPTADPDAGPGERIYAN